MDQTDFNVKRKPNEIAKSRQHIVQQNLKEKLILIYIPYLDKLFDEREDTHNLGSNPLDNSDNIDQLYYAYN